MNKQRGFSVAEVSIVCVVVLLVGVLGYVFYDRWINGVERSETAKTQTETVPTIATANDLPKAEKALDDASLDDAATLSALDADVKSFE